MYLHTYNKNSNEIQKVQSLINFNVNLCTVAKENGHGCYANFSLSFEIYLLQVI